MKVFFSSESEIDLESIADEIAKDSPRRAVTYMQEIVETCLSLRDQPRRFPVIAPLGNELRRVVHGRYLIFYVIRPDHVRIARIIHSARLIDAALFI